MEARARGLAHEEQVVMKQLELEFPGVSAPDAPVTAPGGYRFEVEEDGWFITPPQYGTTQPSTSEQGLVQEMAIEALCELHVKRSPKGSSDRVLPGPGSNLDQNQTFVW